jgi:hypothetical protein
MGSTNETIKKQLTDNGYDSGIAYATQEEIAAGAACGQLAIIVSNNDEKKS